MRVYVGTYTAGSSQGIYCLNFDPATGELREPRLVAEVENPSFLAMHPLGTHLYCCHEQEDFLGQPGGGLGAFAVDPANGNLRLVNQCSSQGDDPCHITIRNDGALLIASNYSGGSAIAVEISENGALGQTLALIERTGRGPHPQRQEASHLHSAFFAKEGSEAWLADLGTDELVGFGVEGQGMGSEALFTLKLKPGAGPRHLACHPSSPIAYLVGELDGSIIILDTSGPTPRVVQEISTLPADFRAENTVAEVAVHPTGRYVYASNRGHNSLVTYGVEGSGSRLVAVEHVASGGEGPRHFCLDPEGRFLLAANQYSQNIVVFAVDRDSGRLSPTGCEVELPSPVCLRFS